MKTNTDYEDHIVSVLRVALLQELSQNTVYKGPNSHSFVLSKHVEM